jgi:hypothetical protein
MAQLRRAARVMDLIAIMVEGDNKRAINTIYAPGLDLCADTIEKTPMTRFYLIIVALLLLLGLYEILRHSFLIISTMTAIGGVLVAALVVMLIVVSLRRTS